MAAVLGLDQMFQDPNLKVAISPHRDSSALARDARDGFDTAGSMKFFVDLATIDALAYAISSF